MTGRGGANRRRRESGRNRRLTATRCPVSIREHSAVHHRARIPSPALPIDADLLRVPVGPGAMHVARYGHGGRPIVLVHGLGTSSFLWREVAPQIAATSH